jgi:outer membrane protein TolC
MVWDGDPMVFHAVRVANADTQIAGFGVEEAEAGWKPNWGAQLTYQQREAGANFAGDDWMSAMVTVSVPLWAKTSQTPRLKAAKAQRSSADMRYQAAARAASARYASRDAAWRAADGTIAALRRNIAAVETKIKAQRRTYEAGAGDYAPLIDGQITVVSLRADLAGQVAQKMADIARMNALMVTP